MKSKLFFFLLLFAIPALADEGTHWQRSSEAQRQIWARGWLDGVAAGQLLAIDAECSTRFNEVVNKEYHRLTVDTLVQGLDQFYASDYRNLAIRTSTAAWFVVKFRAGMTKPEAASLLQGLREAAAH